MARQRDPRRDEAFQIWKQHNGKITNRAIAEQLDVPEKTISAWKSRDKWNVVLQSDERSTTNEKAITSERRKGVKSGNPTPKHSFPKHNSINRKHGLFSKYMHEEQVEIIDAMKDLSFADQLWLQIEIKFSAIIRMQKIMWVEDADDHLKVESGSGSSEFGDSVTYKMAFAYERFESYIRAQTRAMAEYRNMVKSYLKLTDEFDERRMKIESMQLGIDKTRAEIDKLTSQDDDDAQKDVAAALRGLVNELNTKAD